MHSYSTDTIPCAQPSHNYGSWSSWPIYCREIDLSIRDVRRTKNTFGEETWSTISLWCILDKTCRAATPASSSLLGLAHLGTFETTYQWIGFAGKPTRNFGLFSYQSLWGFPSISPDTNPVKMVNWIWHWIVGLNWPVSISGWWFGCHFGHFPTWKGLRLSSQLTNSIIFRGVAKNHQADFNQISEFRCSLVVHYKCGLKTRDHWRERLEESLVRWVPQTSPDPELQGDSWSHLGNLFGLFQ